MTKVNNNPNYKWEWLHDSDLDQWKSYDLKYQNLFNEALEIDTNLVNFIKI